MSFSDFDHVGSFDWGCVFGVADGLRMFRSSMAAFYALPECLFYSFAGPVRRERFHMFRLRLPIRSEVEKVVHWMPEILFAAEIAFCGLH